MAEYYTSFAASLDCPNEEKANALADAIHDMLEKAPEEECIQEPESCEAVREGDDWRLYIAGDNGLAEEIPPIIQEHFKLWNNDSKVIISGNYGCSKPRPGEFGGWAVGITATSIEWVCASTTLHEKMGY